MLLIQSLNYSLLYIVYIRIVTLTLIFNDHPLVEYPQNLLNTYVHIFLALKYVSNEFAVTYLILICMMKS